jgi:UDP-N-acetyl-D-mannosaminuronic acid dehydrogenase
MRVAIGNMASKLLGSRPTSISADEGYELDVIEERAQLSPAERKVKTALDLVVVGGAGHAGLPLSLSFAESGMSIGIYDISEDALGCVERGEMPFLERGADPLLKEMLAAERLTTSSSPAILRRTSQVIVVVGTPIDEFLNPSFTVFERLVDQLGGHLQDGSLLVLRSTVYPGTTAFVARALRERGRSVDVAFCPERIAEGHALQEIRSLPQIIGADDESAADRATQLFGRLADQTIRTTTKEAELAKLFTNTWRYMKFAVANQFFMIAHQAGVDYEKVLHAVRHDYPRAADLPGPGFAAGPCLHKDAMQLAAFTSDHFPLGHAAMLVNEGLPAYVVEAMERRYGSLRGKKVGLLGMAFKADSDDVRGSLSYKLRKLLSWTGAEVLCTDPYVRDGRLLPLERVLAESDILVLGVPHDAYRKLDVNGHDVVDIWGAMAGGIRL